MAQGDGTDDILFLADLVAAHARAAPERLAVSHHDRRLNYGEFYALISRVASSLLRDGASEGDRIAICAGTSPEYLILFMAALKCGIAVVPLPIAASPEQLEAMVRDCAPTHLFSDAFGPADLALSTAGLRRIVLSSVEWQSWLATAKAAENESQFGSFSADTQFNIIYSSGTTGTPKGIVHDHRFRAAIYSRPELFEIGRDAVTLISTPLYSNTTLTVVFPTLAAGGALLLMEKFDARHFLQLAERNRVTHAMLVPVQYRRILADPGFDGFDLSSFQMKYVTSSYMSADDKRAVLDRWPGGLIEYYGLTEGGGSTILFAHHHRDKLHTVGFPVSGHDIRIIDEDGSEVPAGGIGEVVGRGRDTLSHYHNQPAATAASRWTSADGLTFFRTGDLARFDEDGFMIICGRKKDLIISGGFNVYPGDIEAVVMQHDAVREVAVVGVPSDRWGETPVAFAVTMGDDVEADAIKDWANARLGRMQKLKAVRFVGSLPRNAIGKILKNSLRDSYVP